MFFATPGKVYYCPPHGKNPSQYAFELINTNTTTGVLSVKSDKLSGFCMQYCFNVVEC